MIEKIILEYLQECGYKVFLEKPDIPPNEYLLVEKTGSRRSNRIDSATVAIQSYAPSMVAAVELNERMKTSMDDIIELNNIGSCDLNSDYSYNDTQTKSYRYQAVYDITFYGGTQ
jgi:hypothetical protein